ncbi:MAG: OadG family protein [Eubacterium sp.]|nr:OadG family protein [Eubacterium sp.]
MKKKFLKLLVLSLMSALLVSLTGCGEEEALYYEFDKDAMQLYTMELINEYGFTNDIEQNYYLNDGSDLQKSAVSGFLALQTTDHVGEFEGFGSGEGSVEFKNGVDGKVVCSQICNYENRDVKVSISFKENKAFELDKERAYNTLVNQAAQYGLDVTSYVTQMYGSYEELDMTSMDKFLDSYLAKAYNERPFEAMDCEVSAVYSKKELVAMAGKNTAIGMGVVFAVLIFISFIISLLKYLPLLFDAEIRKKRAEKKAAEAAAKKAAEDMIIGAAADDKGDQAQAAPAKADENLINDSELVAVITAAIYAASGSGVRGPAYTASNDKLVVRSIRRVR